MMHPKARTKQLLVEELPEELLVYDTDRGRAHCLNRVAAEVWRSCDGRRDVRAISALVSKQLGQPVDASTVGDALVLLDNAKLLAEAGARTGLRNPARRRALVAGLLIPAVLSISTKAQAASCTPRGGMCNTQNSKCCTGLLCIPSGTGNQGSCG